MNFEPLEKIANAVLYEGFLLYPYRKSSAKNQQRFHFGTLGPPGGANPSTMQTECLLEAEENVELAACVDIKIRFLQEDEERAVEIHAIPLGCTQTRILDFPPIQGAVGIVATALNNRLFRLTVRIDNRGTLGEMLSVHTLLGVSNAAFISLLDPPEQYHAAARACRNVGTFPVMAGREGERTLLFSSPIILYDYPQIAPESVGDFFDGTEIDEMLTLRVLTLSDAEKNELREGDERARQILERTEALPPEQMAKMHGAIRSLRKSSKLEFREGDRVRLYPRKRADIFDMALNGKIAIVESVERDFEDRVHLAVTVEDDPGREFGVMKQIGHRFFFSPEEVELV